METLTVRASLNVEWQDTALIQFPGSEQGDWLTTQVDYLTDYVIDFLERDDYYAVLPNHPVSFYFGDHGNSGWLRFIDDITPSGVSRRYWVNFLDISEFPQGQQNFTLFKFGTMSLVGNLRIKDSMPDRDSLVNSKTSSVTDVTNHTGDLFDYDQERGAATGGTALSLSLVATI